MCPSHPDIFFTHHLQQSTDYRLYKSEPELTTVKEELDEANNEEKDKIEISAEGKDPAASKGRPAHRQAAFSHPDFSSLFMCRCVVLIKGHHYSVGIVSPRVKSPMSTPESSTIASYVTLRKTRKPESRSVSPALSSSRDNCKSWAHRTAVQLSSKCLAGHSITAGWVQVWLLSHLFSTPTKIWSLKPNFYQLKSFEKLGKTSIHPVCQACSGFMWWGQWGCPEFQEKSVVLPGLQRWEGLNFHWLYDNRKTKSQSIFMPW